MKAVTYTAAELQHMEFPRGKRTLYGGEWVRYRITGECSICGSGKVAPFWYSLKMKELRCQKCFKPDGY